MIDAMQECWMVMLIAEENFRQNLSTFQYLYSLLCVTHVLRST